MFGTKMRLWKKAVTVLAAVAPREEQILLEVERTLDRRRQLDSLVDLTHALNKARHSGPLESIAFGFDSSVFLKMATHKNSEDFVDYLESKHFAPIILPGQAVQEFWNNHHAVVEKTVGKVAKKFEELKFETAKIDNSFGDFFSRVDALLSEFHSEYGRMYDKETHRRMVYLLDFLQRRAAISYVPRGRFSDLANVRRMTRTPPGFKDDGHGDFFIWSEFLAGLKRKQLDGVSFSHVVLLTNDVKADWSTDRIAHPLLVAEIRDLLGVTFDVWTIEELWSAINNDT